MADAVNEAEGAGDWPLRPWLLAGLLGAAGLLIHLITGGRDNVPWQMAAAAFLIFGSLGAAFTLEDGRWKGPALFALAVGLVMAGLTWRAVRYGQNLPDEQYGLAAGAIATALALPLFQAGFVRTRLATPYAAVYRHIWTDAIAAAGSLAFTGLSWLALVLLSELFHLLKIDFLREAMDEGWFGWTFSGLAFGAALGILRNETKVLGTLQTVVLLVLSLLAVPLALGLLVFLLATAVSGPQVLWEATRSATPILLTCAAGSFVLASAILRQDDAEMTGNRVMRIAALVLAAVILPLAVFAAVSMGLRLNQYGLAPERLWGLVAIIVACAWGIGYWIALARGGRHGWADKLRAANFHLALGGCVLALLLALPIFDFGAISTRNQVARLESGKVKPEQFDFAALRWDFGEPGRKALERLAQGDNARAAELAKIALRQTKRVIYSGFDQPIRADDDFALRVQPESPELRRMVLDYLMTKPWLCRNRCVAVDIGEESNGTRRVAVVEGGVYQIVLLGEDEPVEAPPIDVASEELRLKEDSKVEIRPWTGRQILIDGKPVGEPFE
jgi:hypothetical protein